MNKNWKKITRENVIKAIDIFKNSNEIYPKARNTFLIFENKIYPAKHIRGLAYKVANGTEISKSEYSGGQETVKFFENLGFEIRYKTKTIKRKKAITVSKSQKLNSPKKNKKQKEVSIRLNPVEQKNALQILFQKHFGIIETEKKFDWLKTPNPNKIPQEYKPIVKKLKSYRNHSGFLKKSRQLLCDIVLENEKLIIEYDENQHFTKSRQITLENYPSNIQLNFSKDKWIKYCEKINAKDNNPVDRDEKRAFYDAVRDIEASKNGYKLIRIKHGDFDWTNKDAKQRLIELISFIDKSKGMKNHKIARIIVTGKQYVYFRSLHIARFPELKILINKFLLKNYGKNHYEFILTPGGFLTFVFPDELLNKLDIEIAEKKYIGIIQKEAEKTINDFFDHLGKSIINKLQKTADYFSIGIDGSNFYQDIELVALYNLKLQKVIHWTGKFYPIEAQKKYLIKINNLDTHFVELNNQKIIILGCHDLSVYNPRGQANAKPNSWKRNIADKFKEKCQKFNPDIILHHPHTTDTPNIWNLAWKTVEKELPDVKHFASGIKYYNGNKKPRGSLDKVLEKTKKGDVIDFN